MTSEGEFYVVARDGRKLIGQNAAQVPIDNGARAITGPDGHARITLPDGSVFALGPGAEIAIDDFVYDPQTSVKKFTVTLVKGAFRWVTGHVLGNTYTPKVQTPAVGVGIRGTDFECSASPDGSGYIKLFSGELELTPYDSNRVILLTAGQMITYTDFNKISGPIRF